MSNRWFAALFAWLAFCLGWFWRINVERGWHLDVIGVVIGCFLVTWLLHRLDRAERS